MSPPEEENARAALVTDFVGFAEAPPQPLADVAPDEQRMLSEAIGRLLDGALAPLHEALRSSTDIVPSFAIDQGEALGNWLDASLRRRIANALDNELADLPWREDEIGDPAFLLRLPNHMIDLVAGEDLPKADARALFPAGGVHGDPNFANVFIAYSGTPPAVTGLSLIDFEWCKCGLEHSPFDDLARIECELLFGPVVSSARELVLATSLGDLWLREDLLDSGGFAPSRLEAVRMVRTRAAALAEAVRSPDEEAAQRAYAITLLGQAARYVAYDDLHIETRGAALFLCQVLAARLARDMSLRSRLAFSERPKVVLHGAATGDIEENSYLMRARSRGAYASLTLPHAAPRGDFEIRCSFRFEGRNEEGWLALGLGIQPDRPEATGLSAGLRWTNAKHARARIHSHESSRHAASSEEFHLSACSNRGLALLLLRRGGAVSLKLTEEGSKEILAGVEVMTPSDQYRGPVALSAFGASIQVFSLSTSSPAPS